MLRSCNVVVVAVYGLPVLGRSHQSVSASILEGLVRWNLASRVHDHTLSGVVKQLRLVGVLVVGWTCQTRVDLLSWLASFQGTV